MDYLFCAREIRATRVSHGQLFFGVQVRREVTPAGHQTCQQATIEISVTALFIDDRCDG
jgi:hypothetical protein